MLFITGLVIALVAAVILPRLRMRRGVKAPDLGRMSEQWLAEYRASHSA